MQSFYLMRSLCIINTGSWKVKSEEMESGRKRNFLGFHANLARILAQIFATVVFCHKSSHFELCWK